MRFALLLIMFTVVNAYASCDTCGYVIAAGPFEIHGVPADSFMATRYPRCIIEGMGRNTRNIYRPIDTSQHNLAYNGMLPALRAWTYADVSLSAIRNNYPRAMDSCRNALKSYGDYCMYGVILDFGSSLAINVYVTDFDTFFEPRSIIVKRDELDPALSHLSGYFDEVIRYHGRKKVVICSFTTDVYSQDFLGEYIASNLEGGAKYVIINNVNNVKSMVPNATLKTSVTGYGGVAKSFNADIVIGGRISDKHEVMLLVYTAADSQLITLPIDTGLTNIWAQQENVLEKARVFLDGYTGSGGELNTASPVDSIYIKARLAINNGRLEEAKVYAAQMKNVDSANYALGRISARYQDYGTAAKYFLSYLKNNDNDTDTWYRYAAVCIESDDAEGADSALRKIDKNNNKYMFRLLKGAVAVLRGDFGTAHKLFRQQLEITPDSIAAQAAMAALYEMDTIYDSAQILYKSIYLKDITNEYYRNLYAEAVGKMADAISDSGRYYTAYTIYMQAYKTLPSGEFLLNALSVAVRTDSVSVADCGNVARRLFFLDSLQAYNNLSQLRRLCRKPIGKDMRESGDAARKSLAFTQAYGDIIKSDTSVYILRALGYDFQQVNDLPSAYSYYLKAFLNSPKEDMLDYLDLAAFNIMLDKPDSVAVYMAAIDSKFHVKDYYPGVLKDSSIAHYMPLTIYSLDKRGSGISLEYFLLYNFLNLEYKILTGRSYKSELSVQEMLIPPLERQIQMGRYSKNYFYNWLFSPMYFWLQENGRQVNQPYKTMSKYLVELLPYSADYKLSPVGPQAVR